MKLIVDMNLSPFWVPLLRNAGYEAEHWSKLGPANATDIQIMTYAAKHNFVVLTYDLDFGAILAATGGAKPSVIQIRAPDVAPEVIGKQLIASLKQVELELQAGALVTVEPDRHRLRLLPLPEQK
ncbi:MAG TPA: DUF5615 family PIN-like protein [Phycisphaerae bacterium]|nr:DUF5615 family PIN-like protein [Phycisphaerae bacterium]